MKKLLGTTVAFAVMAIFISSAPSTVNAQSVTDDDTLGDLTCLAGQTVKFNGTAWVCDPPRLVDNGNGTITDNQTGLMWEKSMRGFKRH